MYVSKVGPSLSGVTREGTMNGKRIVAMVLALVLCGGLLAGPPREAAAQAKPEGEMRWAL
jgi:hypothetical protein